MNKLDVLGVGAMTRSVDTSDINCMHTSVYKYNTHELAKDFRGEVWFEKYQK